MAISLPTKKHLFKEYNVEEIVNWIAFFHCFMVSKAPFPSRLFSTCLFIPLYKCLSMMFWLALFEFPYLPFLNALLLLQFQLLYLDCFLHIAIFCGKKKASHV